MEIIANRAFIGRDTLQRLEKGDPGVGIGIVVAVMHALGLLDRIKQVVDPDEDEVGLAHVQEALPKRARSRRAQRTENPDES